MRHLTMPSGVFHKDGAQMAKVYAPKSLKRYYLRGWNEDVIYNNEGEAPVKAQHRHQVVP